MHRVLHCRVLTRITCRSLNLLSNVRHCSSITEPEVSVKSKEGSNCNVDNGSIKDVRQRQRVPDKDTGWVEKLIYSSYFEQFLPSGSYKARLEERFNIRQMEVKDVMEKSAITPPVSLRYLLEDEGKKESSEVEEEDPLQFPYKVVNTTEFLEDAAPKRGSVEGEGLKGLVSVGDKLKAQEVDVEAVLNNDVFDSAVDVSLVDPGTADPRVPQSNVPCGGCGAMLHCQDKGIPGYISSEKFKGARTRDLMGEVCYRCDVLASHQATLNVNVSAEEYPRIVSKIREKYAMVLLLVDLTDFPCSIWPGILDIIGGRRPVFLVGNKVDLIPQDDPDYLKNVEDGLIKSAVEVGMLEANILHTALISAKTGYGVENLISTIFNVWRGRGDIFIMGCTNVGKSSLFNLFLQSDLCKPQAYDLVQRATISQWPGTTLNLLKFPMTSPSGWRKALRTKRLVAEAPVLKAEKREREMQLQMTGDQELATLTGYVGKTFLNQRKLDEVEATITVKDIFKMNTKSNAVPHIQKPGQWNPDDQEFAGHWVYDTPGAVSSNQILDMLTLPELMQSLPKTLIQPRTYFIKPQVSFFVGGLARIDYIEGDAPIRYTLFSNTDLPVTMTLLEDADEIYQKAFGTKVLGVPFGSEERLKQFPELKRKSLDLKGTGHNCSCADLVLSSIGWIALTGGHSKKFRILIHTPDGKGIFFRQPALLPYIVNLKGKRIRGTYSYLPHTLYKPNRVRRKEKRLERSSFLQSKRN